MRYLFLIIFTNYLLIFSNCNDKESKDDNFLITEKLSKIEGVNFITETGDETYNQCFKLEIEQPLNHHVKGGYTFKQKVYLYHFDLTRPTVIFFNGYSINTPYVSELAKIIGANQVYVEHRFFGDSKPKNYDWNYLNIEQAAADYHRIIKILKQIYKGKWLSTGISKGGQTVMFHSFYYPKDVDVSVPYVAPLNFSAQDERLINFFDKVGTKECREKINNFQKLLLKNKDKLLPAFKKNAENKEYSFKILGIEKAYEYMVLEYEFAFWQWQFSSCEEIPTKIDDAEKIIEHIEKNDAISFFSDESIESFRPFFYQALTEIGFYTYNINTLKKLLVYADNPDFNFTMPKGIEAKFNDTLMQSVNNYIQNDANNFIYIYGGSDPWSAPAVELIKGKTNSFKMVKKDGSHRTRINSFSNDKKNRIIDSLKVWLDIDIKKYE